MSHYSQVQAIFKAIDDSDLNALIDLFDLYGHPNPPADLEEYYEELANSMLFVLVSMKSGMQSEAWKEFRERITRRTVNHEIADMFWTEEEIG